jgi:hypothetical protein
MSLRTSLIELVDVSRRANMQRPGDLHIRYRHIAQDIREEPSTSRTSEMQSCYWTYSDHVESCIGYLKHQNFQIVPKFQILTY